MNRASWKVTHDPRLQYHYYAVIQLNGHRYDSGAFQTKYFATRWAKKIAKQAIENPAATAIVAEGEYRQ